MKRDLAKLLLAYLALFTFGFACFQGILDPIKLLGFGQTRQIFLVSETWVDDDYNESTQGWGFSHFRKIQDGINSVTSGGVVHVASGSYYENAVVNRTVLLVGEDESRTIIDGNYTRDFALAVTANYVSINGFTIQNCIYLGRETGGLDISSWYNSISNIDFIQNWIDITIFGKHNRISSSTMNASFWNIKVFADNNSFLENHLSNSYTALSLNAASGNSIENNTIVDEYIGISLYEGTQNKIAANFAFNCSQNALRLESYSTNNTVTQNTFSDCSQGINEDVTSGANKFYHNRFINNMLQASIDGSENKWDNDYPSGGNYWSDYNGTDLNQDGIGDTPYIIDPSNQDRYPLMRTWTNIAISDLTASRTIIGQGTTITARAVVENQGLETENTNITVYANTTTIYRAGISISGKSLLNVTFTWNTTGFEKGNYTINAVADPVLGETEIDDNNRLLDVTIREGILGDVNADGRVDMKDVAYIAKRFGSDPSSPLWDPNADLNDDGRIDMKDVATVARNFGKTSP